MTAKEAVTETLAKGNEETDELGQPKHNYVLKMDLRLIPILGCTYTILFLDRTNSTFTHNRGRIQLTLLSRQC
jgi:hypothetical protein